MQKMIAVLSVLCLVLLMGFSIVQAQDEPVTLTVWYHTYPPALELLEQQATEFEEMKDGQVNVEIVDYPHGDYEVRLLAALAAGTGPDVINLLDYKFPEYVDKGLLATISPEAFGAEDKDALRAMYEPDALQGLSVDGEIYGVPAENNTLALFLNAQMFEEAGLDASDPEVWPETWEELFDLAEQLTTYDDNGNIEQIGFNWVWGLDPYWYAQQYWPILLQYDCQVLNEEQTEALIDSENCVQAFDEVWNRLIMEDLGGPAVATVNPVNALEDFSIGRQAMMIAGIWAPPAFEENEEVYNNYVVAPLPQLDPEDPVTLQNAYALAVNSASEDDVQELAWEFIDYVTSDSEAWLAESGYVTGRIGWADTPAAEEVRGVPIFQEGKEHGVYVWRSPVWTQQGTIIKEAIERFASGEATVEEALSQAAEELDETLE